MQPRTDVSRGKSVREAIHLPRFAALPILSENLLEPWVGSAVGADEFVRALYGVSGATPEERHGQLLGVVHDTREGIAEQTQSFSPEVIATNRH